MKTPAYSLRLMTKHDLPACQRLREQIGWNQLLSDWQRFHALNPSGCFVVTDQNQIVGTVCTVIYERSGWVAMVIVDQNYRRQGIGQILLMAGIEHLENHGVIVRLDATPEGKLLYNGIGFKDEYKEARFECDTVKTLLYDDYGCQALHVDQLDALEDFDRPVFGESRRQVLFSYLQYYPDYAFCLKDHRKIKGYILARDGSRAFHIGPWVAYNAEDARTLFCHCINIRRPKRVYVDIPAPNPQVWDMLRGFGFQQQRPFIRMYRGETPNSGKPEFVYGLSGPELG